MNLVFLTNYVNHHQIPVADEFYKLLGGNYTYVAMDELPDWLKIGGYSVIEREYILKAYSGHDVLKKVQELTDKADVVIIGSAPEYLVQKRLRENKITFHYSERWLKSIDYHLLSPSVHWNRVKFHTRFRNKNSFMLCASAYLAQDVKKWFAYPDKCFKWGYFTQVDDFDLEASLVSRRGNKVRLMWCARFLAWKHPELPIGLAKRLKDDGYSFELNMFGTGPELEKTRALASALGVSDLVSFCGNLPNDELMQEMRQCNIFLFTSDRNEGWGAVLNESMSNGCAVVASDKIGAVPFLIQDHENGMIFKSKDLQSLYVTVKTLIDDKNLRERISRNAYKSMCHLWNPRNAAKCFVRLASSLLNNEHCMIDEGPCSKAYPVKLHV